jgi:unsaturated rhamnogalacturonyl hydrolase
LINFRNLIVVLLISAFSLSFLDFTQSENHIQKGKGKIVGLDYFYNHEFKNDKDGKKIQFHYIWEDEENSGYSVLGKIIKNNGALISEIKKAPSDSDLEKLSIYIIVDPDTPLETASPNYVSDSSITIIERWVKNGGVLVLLANDKGNCEFLHFNNLASKFGIHFNEDSRNKVVGNNYDMGKFDKFPVHPLFNSVKKIYLKEISTLKLDKPAKPILTEGKDIIMAGSAYGKGFVFAAGDPWFYNEYIDNRILPAEFENYRAASNLFEWLLGKSVIVTKGE